MPIRRRIFVQGTVQGIGFRPFVYRIAGNLGLSGYVRNDGEGVVIEIQGSANAADRFVDQLFERLPLGGVIDRHRITALPPDETAAPFQIEESRPSAYTLPNITPDRNVCDECLAELRDPDDRRYRYPFINCTHCGPRYTIVERLPYDRPNTSLADFPLCDACRAEYTDPENRRFHAEPVACPVCGPEVELTVDGIPMPSDDPITEAARLLHQGKVVAIKGIGGFHLAVNADDRAAVDRLRTVKRRPGKPFALMVKSLKVADRLVRLNERERALLAAPEAPIVLAPARPEATMKSWIAPGLGDIGIMLPYSPLHHLLLDRAPPILVMTSGNPAAEPIATRNDEAGPRLGADATLRHNRKIVTAADDSVIRTAQHGPIVIRRARGYVPVPFDAGHLPDRSVLALGALLKVTVSALHRGRLIVGRHLGDLDNERTETAFEEEVERMLAFLNFEPARIALDLHPDLPSSDFAGTRFPSASTFRIQHHHAHMAAVMAEHGMSPETEVVGIVLDGFGFGTDRTVWGGEVMVGGYTRFHRTARLRPIPQPGGDMAALEPGRMAASLLHDADLPLDTAPGADRRMEEILAGTAPLLLTSSAGRLFDGFAALLGIAPARQSYEGEAAARLEAVAAPDETGRYPLPMSDDMLDTRALTRAAVADTSPVPIRAARFINGLADGLVRAAAATHRPDAVMGGGCMVNRLLVSRLLTGLEAAGIRAYLPRRLPPGDGAVSAGQVAVAACSDPEACQ